MKHIETVIDLRYVYIARHGEPLFENSESRCVGITDYPISTLGKIQSRLIEIYLRNASISAVYCSNLKRSKETAAFICEKPIEYFKLREINMGKWDGMTFAEIRREFPELYERRGKDPSANTPPGAESFQDAQSRIVKAFSSIVSATTGNIAIVAHAGVIRLLLCNLLKKPISDALKVYQPYGCVNIIEINDGRINDVKIGETPKPELNYSDCVLLLKTAGATENLIAHCKAVAEVAAELADTAKNAGIIINKSALINAAILHDIAKGSKNHAETGAKWLRLCGYNELAEIIELHMDYESGGKREAEALFLADKLVLGSKRVTLDERFKASRIKCVGDEALAALEKRYDSAKKAYDYFYGGSALY